MVIFLNLDGSALKVTPENIYQGSNNVINIDVIAPYPNSTALEIGFIMPDGFATAYSPMEFVMYDEAKKLSVWSFKLQKSITAQMGDLYVAINAITARSNTTSYLVKAIVQESIIPLPPPEPLPGSYEQLLLLYQQLANRLQLKTLLDFTVEVSSGIGTKYYSDGTTSTVQFPVGSPPTVKTDYLRVMEFDEDSFVLENDTQRYMVAFGREQTGFSDDKYLSVLDKSDTMTYEAGVEETTPSERQGYSQLADSVFKGQDGSLLLHGISTPFKGRILLLGGNVFGGEVLADVRFNNAVSPTELVFSMINNTEKTVQLEGLVNDAAYVHTDNNFTDADKADLSQIKQRDAVTGVTYDENTYILKVSFRYSDPIAIQLPSPTAAQRYYAAFASTAWEGNSPPYTIAIPSSLHGRGINPMWQFYDNQYFEVEKDSNGNLIIKTNTKKQVNIVII